MKPAAAARFSRAFTLLEVMIAVGVLGIALLSLLSVHHQNLQGVIRAQQMSQAAMLAQGLMTQAELERFPLPGKMHGDFERMFPGAYRNFRWERVVEPSEMFPDIRRVDILVTYGPRFRNSFSLTEFLHNPEPMPMPGPGGQPVPGPEGSQPITPGGQEQ